MSGDLEQLRRLEPNLGEIAKHVEVIAVGPFRALLSRTSEGVWKNTAVPVEPLGGADEVREGLRELQRLVAERQCTLRLEFNEPLYPALPSLLEWAGLRLEEREPIMICTPSDFRPFFNPEVSVRFLQATDPDSDLAAFQTIFDEGLAHESWQPTPEAIGAVRREIERARGRGHALASLGGVPVGTGFIWSANGVCELTRIVTIPSERRRGVGATLTTFMMKDRFEGGDTLAWLTVADAPAQGLYQKLGFRLVGERLCYQGKITSRTGARGSGR